MVINKSKFDVYLLSEYYYLSVDYRWLESAVSSPVYLSLSINICECWLQVTGECCKFTCILMSEY